MARTPCASGTASTRATLTGSRCRDALGHPLRSLRHAGPIGPVALAGGARERQGAAHDGGSPPPGLPALCAGDLTRSVRGRALLELAGSGAYPGEAHREVPAP